MSPRPNDTKKLFRTKGTCSHTFFYLLDRQFGQSLEEYERASDPLAGGILSEGHQCGMLWGAALALGAEAFRREKDPGEATARAMEASRTLVNSFQGRAGCVNCRELTGYTLKRPFDMVRFVLFKTRYCFDLAEKWTPEALRVAREEFGEGTEVGSPDEAGRRETVRALDGKPCRSCASEVVRQMGGSEQEAVMAAGLAGGIGLSGQACGALGAAVWMKSLRWCREHPGKPSSGNPEAKKP